MQAWEAPTQLHLSQRSRNYPDDLTSKHRVGPLLDRSSERVQNVIILMLVSSAQTLPARFHPESGDCTTTPVNAAQSSAAL